jgi:hypothetical protein
MKPYKQGIVNTDDHPVLRKTQIVNVLAEDGDFYIVKPFMSTVEIKISKKDFSNS